MSPRKLFTTMALASFLAFGQIGAGKADNHEDPQELAREGMERMIRAIELMIEMIPQYDMPEVTDDGDIIIKRRNPPKQDDHDHDHDDEAEESQT